MQTAQAHVSAAELTGDVVEGIREDYCRHWPWNHPNFVRDLKFVTEKVLLRRLLEEIIAR